MKIPFVGLQKQYSNLRTEILDITDTVHRSGQLMDGNYTAEFENWLAKKNNVKHAVTVHSGTNALEVIAAYYRHILEIGQPSVIVPAMTFRATANAWLNAGWRVVFADCNSYGMLNINSVKEHWPDVVAVCLVGLYGNSLKDYRTKKFIEHRTDENWLVIEDAAQHWLSWDCRRIGPAAAISFDPMKNLGNYGNGGAIVTNVQDIADYAKSYRAHGKLFHPAMDTGTNSRMSEIDCATMLVKAQYIDEWQARRKTIATYWMERLLETPLRCLIDSSNVKEHCFHKFVVELDNRDVLAEQLASRGIDTKVHYEEGLNEMNYSAIGFEPMMSATASLCRRVLSLPIYPELTDLEVDYIIDQVLDCVA